ncbi:tyrosine-type recombinase/integrase [Paraferrimonas sedimenticola]|uniref:Integrase n=1 Tax=Paraferrimonas sedimenticola TaxID=375674 RepID=A0AA37RQQ0_9GAMM|nr:site-specific integrase [Paraferrimonas sedimenticola]GLP94713.1 integrase [Paraferrimonas sedimenticola]
MALCKRDIEQIKANPSGKERAHKHTKGLYLRETKAGVLSWLCRYSFEGKQYKLTLNKLSEMSIRQAEDRHQDILDMLAEGLDPKSEQEGENPRTVKELCDSWYSLDAQLNRKRPEIAKESIDLLIVPVIGHIKLNILKKRHVNMMTDACIKRGAGGQAKKALGLFRQICLWAFQRSILSFNPTADINKSRLGGKSSPRERTLKDEEISVVWNTIGNLGLSKQVEIGVKILIATGQRRGEITRCEWSEVRFDSAEWYIPKEKSKNGKEHLVPLSPLVIELFKELKRFSNGSAFVMPGASHRRSQADGHMTEKAITRAIARKQCEFLLDGKAIEKWVAHDLRRTAMSRMAGIGVGLHIIELIANHRLPDMLRVYVTGVQEDELFEMQRRALNQWAEHLKSICGISSPRLIAE